MSCVKKSTKKYLTRPSPPFPASLCCGMVMKGNDGDSYHSVANKNGVCRWVRVKDDKNSVRKVRKVKNNVYHVTVVMGARSSLDPPRRISDAMLNRHLKKYFDLQEIATLVDWNEKEWMQNVKLKKNILTFDVPKTVSTHLDHITNKARLKRHIMHPGLADGAWESSSSNFFLMIDDKSQNELATISPVSVTVS